MNNQLYINEKLIPLSEGSLIALSFQVNNIASIKDVRGNNSNTFTIKANAPTNHALGFSNLPTSDTRIPYRQLPARYLQNGVDLLKGGGYAVVQEYRDYEKEFDVELYSGNLDFFATIDGKSIKDLNLSLYNHLWNADVIRASFANTAGYIYSLIDYGTAGQAGNTLRTDQLFPGFYLHTLINQVFFEAGFELEGPILTDPRHQQIILPFVNGKTFIAEDFGKNRSFRAGPLTNDLIHYAALEEGDKPVIFGDDFTTRLNFFQGVTGNYNHTTGEYTVDKAMLADLAASVGYWGDMAVGTAHLRLKMVVNGVMLGEAHQEVERISPLTSPHRQGTLSIAADNLDFQAGDVLKLVVNVDGGGLTSYQFDFLTPRDPGGAFPQAYWSFAVKDEVPFGSEWQITPNLPDISQIDLLKNWAQTFGLIFQTDSNSRTVSVRQFEEIANNAPLARDFSGKLITSRSARQTWRLDYAQKNLLTYAPEEDANGRPVIVANADGVILVDDHNLEVTKELFEMVYSATPMKIRLGGLLLANIPLFVNYQIEGEALPRILVMERQDVSTGILLADNAVNIVSFEFPIDDIQTKITTDRPHKFTDGQLVSIRGGTGAKEKYNVTDYAVIADSAYNFRLVMPEGEAWTLNEDELGSVYVYSNPSIVSTAIPIPYFILPGKTFNLGFADNLIEKNYQRLVNMLNPLQVQEAYFKLSEVDIDELDQFIPVWVGAYGAYYFLQNVKDFSPDALTRCLLIRL